MTQEEKVVYWRGMIETCQANGSAIAVFCREHEIAEWQFYYWRRRFRETDQGTSEFVELSVVRNESSGVSLSCGNINIELERNFDEVVLSRVLRSLSC